MKIWNGKKKWLKEISGGIMHKEYIEREYQLAMSDFILAKTEDEQWNARRAMARLEQIAASAYGFEYADSLKNARS